MWQDRPCLTGQGHMEESWVAAVPGTTPASTNHGHYPASLPTLANQGVDMAHYCSLIYTTYKLCSVLSNKYFTKIPCYDGYLLIQTLMKAQYTFFGQCLSWQSSQLLVLIIIQHGEGMKAAMPGLLPHPLTACQLAIVVNCSYSSQSQLLELLEQPDWRPDTSKHCVNANINVSLIRSWSHQDTNIWLWPYPWSRCVGMSKAMSHEMRISLDVGMCWQHHEIQQLAPITTITTRYKLFFAVDS